MEPNPEFYGNITASIAASRDGHLRSWWGTARPRDFSSFQIPIAVAAYRFEEAVESVIRASGHVSQYSFGVRHEITGHTSTTTIDKPGIWLFGEGAIEYLDVPDEPPPPPTRQVAAASASFAFDGNFCLCGCGTAKSSPSKFLPGHDMKLKGRLMKAIRSNQQLDNEILGTNNPRDVARHLGWIKIAREGTP